MTALSVYDTRKPLQPPLGLIKDLPTRELWDPNLKQFNQSRDFQAEIDRDNLPIPAIPDREHYHAERHFQYWLSGAYDASLVLKDANLSGSGRILDFGGASGRVARHYAAQGYETWVCDMNVNHIDWLEQHAPNINAVHTRPFPHFPFEDNYFDVVSAFSVFTHIADSPLQYLLELRRITKPGGLIYFTIFDEGCWDYIRQTEWLRKSIARGQDAEMFLRDIDGPLPSSPYIVRYESGTSNVFYNNDHVPARWMKYFSNHAITQKGHGFQTVVSAVV